jgi:hypothetical protein
MDDLIRALPQLLRAAGEAEEVAETAAFVAWRRAAGEQLRTAAVPFRLYRKTLVVAVPDTSWRQQLEAISGQLLFRVNSILGQPVVTYIEFRVDPQTVGKERERQQLRRAQTVRTAAHEEGALRSAAELEDAASAIRDEDLRRRFLVAAGSYIEAQERK